MEDNTVTTLPGDHAPTLTRFLWRGVKMAEIVTTRGEIEGLVRKPELLAGELVSAGAGLMAAKHGKKIAQIWLHDASKKIGATETSH
jgi:hypothetical protein